jgi:hypothetical protein
MDPLGGSTQRFSDTLLAQPVDSSDGLIFN